MGKISKNKFNFNGETYDFELNLNAMIKFEEEAGKSLMDMKAGDKFGLVDIRALLWAGLSEHKDISIDEVGKLVNIGNMEEVADKVMESYKDAMPESKGRVKGKNKNRSVG